MFVGQNTNPDLTNDRAQVVAASTAHCDGAHNHEFIQVLGVGKFCDFGAFCVAAFEDFFQIHFGHTPRRVLGIVIVLSIDHHAVQNGLHFLSHFVEQVIQLTGLNEFSNVVVGMEAFAGC